jgi:hypothetical protein
MKYKKTLTAMALVLVFSSSGWAREPMTTSELIDHLEEALGDCTWKTRNMTGAPKLKMLLHKRTMEDALEALKAGRVVDSKKLEVALSVHAS